MENTVDQPRKKRPGREIKGEWPDSKVMQLISVVEQRPELWDVRCEAYRVQKPQVWQEVAAELGSGADWQVCRAKWQNLRVTYKFNLAKLYKRKSELGPEETARVHWRFFNAMKFIGKGESQPSSQSTSNLNVIGSSSSQSGQCTSVASTLGQQQKRPTISGTSKPPSFESSTMRGIAEQLLQVISKTDMYSIFGDYIAAELRSFETHQAHQLKRRLTRTLMDFMDEIKSHTKVGGPEPISKSSDFTGKIAEIGSFQFTHSKTNESNPASLHEDFEEVYVRSIKEESSISYVSDSHITDDDADVDLPPKIEPKTSKSVSTQCDGNEFTNRTQSTSNISCTELDSLTKIKLEKEIALLEMEYKIKEVDLLIKKEELKKLTKS